MVMEMFGMSCHYDETDILVGIATTLTRYIYRLYDRGTAVRFPEGKIIFFLLQNIHRSSPGPTQHPSKWTLKALSAGVKRQGHTAGHLLPFKAKHKKEWSYTSPPPYALMACTETTLEFTRVKRSTRVKFRAYWLLGRTNKFNIYKFYVLPTQCIYAFCIYLTAYSDFFPV
jgi:hypothetical protein